MSSFVIYHYPPLHYHHHYTYNHHDIHKVLFFIGCSAQCVERCSVCFRETHGPWLNIMMCAHPRVPVTSCGSQVYVDGVGSTWEPLVLIYRPPPLETHLPFTMNSLHVLSGIYKGKTVCVCGGGGNKISSVNQQWGLFRRRKEIKSMKATMTTIVTTGWLTSRLYKL